MVVAYTRLLPFAVLNGLAILWAIYSPSDIMKQHPRLFLWTIGLLNSKLVVRYAEIALNILMLVLGLASSDVGPFMWRRISSLPEDIGAHLLRCSELHVQLTA